MGEKLVLKLCAASSVPHMQVAARGRENADEKGEQSKQEHSWLRGTHLRINHIIVESFDLEGTFQGHLVQPSYHVCVFCWFLVFKLRNVFVS